MSSSTRRGAHAERGQILVIVALVLVAIVVMVGLILDGGAAYAQRRSQQNAADMAAMAGANAFLLTGDQNAARAAALAVAATNGWTNGTNGTGVVISFDMSNGASVTVDVNAPHHNTFGTVIGIHTWDVGTTATALTGYPDTAYGAAPFIFNIDVFDGNGQPLSQYANPASPVGFGEVNGDAPETPGDIAWTNYGSGNVNTNTVRQIIQGNLVINKTLEFGEYIGQHNQGNHTALYGEVQNYLAGTDVVVPVVDDGGNFQGWASFHVTSAAGGSTKKIFGYFKSNFVSQRLSVAGCATGSCPRFLGSYVLKLVD